MHPNEQLIHKFYTCFQQKDYKGMQECYADNATFSDAVFKNLDAAQVKGMWEMLCIRGKDLQLEYKDVWADDNTGHAEWIATYTFTGTGKKVVNNVRSEFRFENGKIVAQNDHFDFYRWARQALGTPGKLLGWTGALKNKVQKTAKKNLDDFMKKN